MNIPDVFDKEAVATILDRLSVLESDTVPGWGKMDAAKMLAHLNVAYEMVYEDIHPKPNFFMAWVLRTFIKKGVVGTNGYPKSAATAPQFLIKSDKNFDVEKARLVTYLQRMLQEGPSAFEGRPSHSFGKLTANEYKNMLGKHLEHHFTQFGL